VRTLLVISDSAFYKNGEAVYAYEPVVRELETLTPLFDKIIWLGSKVKQNDNALRKPTNSRIKLVVMPSVRHRILNPFFVLLCYPVFTWHILKHLRTATHIHTRGPSHPAFIGLITSFFSGKPFWHKYAGNWVSKKLPVSYALQRKLLTANRNSITVNGNWDTDAQHIRGFENPCLTENEIVLAQQEAVKKDFSMPFKLLYVGELNAHKGIIELVEAVENDNWPGSIADLYIVGDGALYDSVKRRIESIKKLRVHLTGKLSRPELNKLYAMCHILIVPSSTEGFPKVIAEAAAYGCVPVANNVSAISQYISNGQNGFLMGGNTSQTIAATLSKVLQSGNLTEISKNAMKIAPLFTYERYKNRVQKEIFLLD
jgi:glycosyltransferase involved in cell wall biosynthesis